LPAGKLSLPAIDAKLCRRAAGSRVARGGERSERALDAGGRLRNRPSQFHDETLGSPYDSPHCSQASRCPSSTHLLTDFAGERTPTASSIIAIQLSFWAFYVALPDAYEGRVDAPQNRSIRRFHLCVGENSGDMKS
jgi:hypothetical protein